MEAPVSVTAEYLSFVSYLGTISTVYIHQLNKPTSLHRLLGQQIKING